MGIGVLGIVQDLQGNLVERFEITKNYGIGTSNEAEWMACCHAMKLIREVEQKYAGEIHGMYVFSDSQLIAYQFNGKYQINKAHLRPYYEYAQQVKSLTRYRGEIRWIKRDFNQEADGLSKIGLLCQRESWLFTF